MQRAIKERTAVTYNGLSLVVDGEPRRAPSAGQAGVERRALRRSTCSSRSTRSTPASDRQRAESELDLIGGFARSGGLARERAPAHQGEPAGHDRGGRDLERGAAGDQRGAARLERRAAEHQRGAAERQRGALHGQRRVPEEDRRAHRAHQRHGQPAASIQVGTIFLDRKLCIRKFTPLIAEVFNLLPQDVGRPIAGFSTSLNYTRLLDDLERGAARRSARSSARSAIARELVLPAHPAVPDARHGARRGAHADRHRPLKAAENALSSANAICSTA